MNSVTYRIEFEPWKLRVSNLLAGSMGIYTSLGVLYAGDGTKIHDCAQVLVDDINANPDHITSMIEMQIEMVEAIMLEQLKEKFPEGTRFVQDAPTSFSEFLTYDPVYVQESEKS